MLTYPHARASGDYLPMTNTDQISAIADKAHSANVERICKRIRGCCTSVIEQIIETGQLLIELKEACPHGEWKTLVQTQTPLELNKAQKFMLIARNQYISNTARAQFLPAKWSILADIAKLSDAEIQQGIERKLITPSMDRNTARSLPSLLRGTSTNITTGIDAEAAPSAKDAAKAEVAEKKKRDQVKAQHKIDLQYCQRITFAVGAVCGVNPEQILHPTRHSAAAALARQLVAYMLCTLADWSTTRAAVALSRDRTTIEHGRDLIFELRAEHEDVDQWVEDACVIVVEALKLANCTPEAIQVRGIAA